jgi:hypothetical protein
MSEETGCTNEWNSVHVKTLDHGPSIDAFNVQATAGNRNCRLVKIIYPHIQCAFLWMDWYIATYSCTSSACPARIRNKRLRTRAERLLAQFCNKDMTPKQKLPPKMLRIQETCNKEY